MALNLDTLGLSATVTAQGISAPDYQTVLKTLTGYFRQIYGADAYLEPDSKDGQMVALVALSIHDANNMAIAVYNSFSPATGQGAGLSSNVKINGITRKTDTNSTVDLLLAGVAGTTITKGSVKDDNNVIWNLPPEVVIDGGKITVTATCAIGGAIAALAGTITTINTPTRGWLSVINPVAAMVGSPAETDAELRIRQGQSVALPSITPFEGVDGAIANVEGVTRHKLYENDTGATDSNGLPPHSISVIVDGGDIIEIAQTIRGNKGQGTATYGKTSVTVPDTYGNPHVIRFSRSTDVPIFVAITLKVFTGYTSKIGDQIKQAVVDYINGLTIGDNVILSRIYSPANLGVVSGGNARYYDITDLLIGKSSGSVSASNIGIAYDASASCSTANISITAIS
ncbi:baseplate J/gp47 family protein [Hafnia paralvei]|uniref:baseplate J/gp47 family protein n=1 Tax=Hafnia paralvei TaxID=546367 RepID=UPI0024BA334C|nr:baseplate J/gp47 family protein [Hafnia paralvei]